MTGNITQLLSNYKNATQDADKVNLLTELINIADKHYYIDDNPLLADREYDELFATLKKLENAHPELMKPDSPTQRIAYGLSEQLKATPHLVPMLSLENSYNEEDLVAWDKRNKDALHTSEIQYSVEPKYDGAGISLIYNNNVLAIAATRGDGISGEDITRNAKQIKSIPLSADFLKNKIDQIEIRGEVVIKKNDFQKYNESRINDGLAPLANPRNAASGTLRMLDPEEVRKRSLFAILYNVSYISENGESVDVPSHLDGHYQTMQWLANIGFVTPLAEMHLTNSIQEALKICEDYEAKRDDLPYEIDGMVIKVNSYSQQDTLGITSHHPRWAMAFKFKARQATSVLKEVMYQVGRTGTITPVAKIEPVYIGGVTISSISLFNEDIIKEKDLMIGDTVLVERAGDVIPYIVKSIPENRRGTELPIIFPKECPVCGDQLVKTEGEVAWRCINTNCEAQVVEKLIHFVSKDAMDIRNLGASNIRRFYEEGLIHSIQDIYHLDFDKISRLDKFGEKSIANLKSSIEDSKHQSLNRLIFALGIRYVGETTAKTLSNTIRHILDLEKMTVEQLEALDDVGPKVANSIVEYFGNADNVAMIHQLINSGVKVEKSNEELKEENAEGKFSGKTFLFTGTLEQMKRAEAEAMVEAQKGKILGSVSSKLNYLVVGKDAGSKLEKAKKLGTVDIITEEEFLKMVR